MRHEPLMEGAQQRLGIGGIAAAHEDDLARLPHTEFARRQHVRQGHGRGRQTRGEGRQQAFGRGPQILAIGDFGQPQQVHQRHRIAGGLGAVVIFFDAQHQPAVACRGAEKRALRGVFEQLALLIGEPQGQVEVPPVELRLVEIQQRLHEERVIVEEAGDGGVALPVAAQQDSALGLVQMRDQKLRSPARRGGIARLIEHRAALGEGRNHEAVPGSENLVVEVRPRALLASGQERLFGAAERGADLIHGAIEVQRGVFDFVGLVKDVAAGELAVRVVRHVAGFDDAVAMKEPVGGRRFHQRANLFRAPDIEGALAFDGGLGRIGGAVGIFGGVKGAAGIGHVAQHVVEDAPGHGGVLPVAGNLKSFQVRDGKLPLVVEHFFEMRHEPALVHGVAMEAAAELVMHAALGHLAEGLQHHFEGVFALRARVVAE